MSGCPIKPELLKLSAEEYLEVGQVWEERGREDKAIPEYLALFNSYPRSPLAPVAMKAAGDAYFSRKDWATAHAQYVLFFEYYPQHELVDQVLFSRAIASWEQQRGKDRDLNFAKRSLNEFRLLIKQQPASELVPISEERIREIRELLADHEFYVGRNYHRFKHHEAAILRFQGILTDYPDYSGLDETYLFLGEAFADLEAYDRAREALNQVIFNAEPGRTYDQALKIRDSLPVTESANLE